MVTAYGSISKSFLEETVMSGMYVGITYKNPKRMEPIMLMDGRHTEKMTRDQLSEETPQSS